MTQDTDQHIVYVDPGNETSQIEMDNTPESRSTSSSIIIIDVKDQRSVGYGSTGFGFVHGYQGRCEVPWSFRSHYSHSEVITAIQAVDASKQ